MKEYRVAISCIGSGVGQSVINSLKNSNISFFTLGLGTNPYAYGSYECDAFDYTKSIYEEGFIDDLIKKCESYEIDLVIPGLDDEALLYAKNLEKFNKAGLKTIVSDVGLIELCRDKERMSEVLNPIVNIFVKSYKKEEIRDNLEKGIVNFPFIAKPRGGFASRGIEIIRQEKDLEKIQDYHILQELAAPLKSDPNYAVFQTQIEKNINPQVAEISIQLVYGEDQNLLGKMASYNKLRSGVPIEILPYDQPEMWEVIDQLAPELLKLGLRGPINIQGRMTEKGLKIFEMNPRFTGITGLRSLMGFNEVESCVKEFLGIDKGRNQININRRKFGMRQTADKVVLIDSNHKVSEQFKALNPGYKSIEKPVLLLTGSSGLLGRHLVQEIKKKQSFEIWLLGRDKQKLKDLFGSDFNYFDYEDFQKDRISLGSVDTLAHLGFARLHTGDFEIAKSVAISNQLFMKACLHQVPYIINISSQSVYGNSTEYAWSEKSPINPKTTYSQAKYAVESFLENLRFVNKQGKLTSLRLSALVGVDNDVDFVSKMIKSALEHNQIQVFGGSQVLQRLDVKDAAQAINILIEKRNQINQRVYNLGSEEQLSVLELAQIIKQQVENTSPHPTVEIKRLEVENTYPNMMMDSTLFYESFQWKPSKSMKKSIEEIIKNS
ncbi:NAD-dependent epimerase/dehydratase family protein [Algoriphagus limi]|uniref:ATP-grasp domain-containing protein n=1 Tax=Algoriphagus limi TaxID=2975273 RepID=A0ABT2G1Q3_9BACT|nr:NAD-dependent epimerase/dehydratase family protein [Algoriphagus limi]MCS5489199.1 ATP-grasp domain-containing protein [Algoriphagus limi]